MRKISEGHKSVIFPSSAHDVKLMHYVEFGKLIENRAKTRNDNVESYNEEIESIIEAVGLVCEGQALALIPFDIEGDVLVGIEGFQIDANARFEDLSILRLFTHCQNLILNYEPNFNDEVFFRFSYNGRVYFLSSAIGKDINSPKLTTGEMIEILEFERLKKAEKLKEGDADGAIYFTTLLWKFAVMMRKAGEHLPTNKSERHNFLANRVELFKNLPMNVVLDLDFFLTRLSIPFLRTQNM